MTIEATRNVAETAGQLFLTLAGSEYKAQERGERRTMAVEFARPIESALAEATASEYSLAWETIRVAVMVIDVFAWGAIERMLAAEGKVAQDFDPIPDGFSPRA